MSQDLKQFMAQRRKKTWLKTLACELSQCKGIKKWSWPELQWQHQVAPVHLIRVSWPVSRQEAVRRCFVFISMTVCLHAQNMPRHSWPHYILRQRGNLQTNTDLNFSPGACNLHPSPYSSSAPTACQGVMGPELASHYSKAPASP